MSDVPFKLIDVEKRSRRRYYQEKPQSVKKNLDISSAIKQYIQGDNGDPGRKPESRYTSFDYCYNYFYSFYKNNRIMEISSERYLQMSCLQLGFYLASWGMLRGSAFLSQKSSRYYSNLIRSISNMPPKLWEIDVDSYNEDNFNLLLNTKKQMTRELRNINDQPSDTLTTKIMLGVFGNIPAFDQYVKKYFRVYSFNAETLRNIRRFYEVNKIVFDDTKIHTLNFTSGEETSIYYPKAKLIDMCGFILG